MEQRQFVSLELSIKNTMECEQRSLVAILRQSQSICGLFSVCSDWRRAVFPLFVRDTIFNRTHPHFCRHHSNNGKIHRQALSQSTDANCPQPDIEPTIVFYTKLKNSDRLPARHLGQGVRMTVDDTGNSNDDSSLCLCSLFPLPRIAELVGSPSSEATFATIEPFQRLVDWIRGKNLPCAKKSGLCRLETARGILQAIRDSLPTVEEPTATAGMKHDTLTRQQSTNQQIQTDLRMNDVCSFPPLALASGTCTSTSTSNCSPQKQQVNAAFPVLGAPSPTKKGKRRIRPAMISTSPLTTIDKTTAESRKSVWGSETKIASWPGTRSSTNHNTSSNLLERRLSATNTHGNESDSSTTSTKINPTVNLSPGPTPTKKILTYDTDSNECLRDGLQKPPPSSLVRLVDLYTAIVESLLVQSTPNEVQYVLRLSHRATTKQFSPGSTTTTSFQITGDE